ncbi:MAG: PKD domain-containing protein, partial [Candidatus Thermoplasmatota archaeon]
QNPVHIYDEPGTYTVELTVDSDGKSVSDTAEVLVYNTDELMIETGRNIESIAGRETMFSVDILGGNSPYNCIWDFGDGEKSTNVNPTHIYTSPGEYTVEVTVTDNFGKSKSDTLTVSVNKVDPVEITEVSGGLFLSIDISSKANSVNWDIHVDGNVFFGGSTSGSLQANHVQKIKTPLTFGFGKVHITINANELTRKYTAFLMGPYFINLKEK